MVPLSQWMNWNWRIVLTIRTLFRFTWFLLSVMCKMGSHSGDLITFSCHVSLDFFFFFGCKFLRLALISMTFIVLRSPGQVFWLNWDLSDDFLTISLRLWGLGRVRLFHCKVILLFSLFPDSRLWREVSSHHAEPTPEWGVILSSTMAVYLDKLFEILLYRRFISSPFFIYWCNTYLHLYGLLDVYFMVWL